MEIEIYNIHEHYSTTIKVEQLSKTTFRMLENEIFNCLLTYGTEFETKINPEGKHELKRIAKKSEYTTRQFMLPREFKESDYRILADELYHLGGFWQIDMGGIATINIPKNFPHNIDQVMQDFNISLTEIV